MNLVEAHLVKMKHKVVGVANDGVHGLEKILKLKPDVVFLDLVLPNMNGLEVAKSIMVDLPESRIIFMSSLRDSRTLSEVEKFKEALFLQKPFTKDQLEDTLGEVL